MSEFTSHIIDEYLLGRLEEETSTKLEDRLSTDSVFASAVQKRKVLIGKVDAYGDYEIKRHLRKIHKQEMNRKSRLKIFKWASYAAVFLLFIGALAYYFGYLQKPEKTEDIYIAYYEPYPLSFFSREVREITSLQKAAQFYTAGDYDQALPLFKDVFLIDSTQSQVRIALGVCEMENQEYNNALRYFEPLIQAPADSDSFQEQALWYGALSYLQNNEVPAAKKCLQQITEMPHSVFYTRAKALSTRL